MKGKLLTILVCIVVMVTIAFAFDRVGAVGSDPGSIADPLVTKSYVDEMNAALLTQVEAKMAGSAGSGTTATPTNMTDLYKYIDDKFAVVAQNGVNVSTGFVVVEVAAGQKLVCEGSTELILRSGEATGVANAAGDGLSDVTSGSDVRQGMMVEKNHLLIVPKTDGRGLLVAKKSYLMVKGNYAIE